MPRFDGTGPQGTGPAGWGMGPCGRGFKRGFCCAPGLTKEQEKEMLEAQKKVLEKRLKELK